MLKFYLIDTFYSKNNSQTDKIVCLIFDTQNYSTSTLTINYNNTQIKVSCDCSQVSSDLSRPLFRSAPTSCELKKSIKDMFCFFFKKQKECIHIKWLSLNYFNCNYTDNWTLKKINNFKLFHVRSITPKGHNIECSICLDNIDYDNENTFYCNVCKNSIHNKCWNKFIIINHNYCKANCCICRTGILRSFIL
jgi:hypothetical protein